MSGALTTPDEGDSPVRAQASPRSTPSMSAGSSFIFNISPKKSESNSPSSDEQSPIRGRTISRVPSTNRESARSRTLTNLEASARFFGFDNTFAYQRLLSRDLTAEPEDIFQTVVEPLPVGVERFRSSLSEELYRAATWENWDESIDLTKFGDHRDTFAILGLRHLQNRRVKLPAEFWQGLLQYIDYETYLSVRLSCRCWSAAISDAQPLHMPPAAGLPTEILENIYKRLDPVDFNSARHTCRAWMIASLDAKLLGLMLKRGGWWGAAQVDMELRKYNDQISPEKVDLEWLLSGRLATECSLRPDWTGNGLFRSPYGSPDGEYSPTIGLVRTSQTDFSELSNGYAPMSSGEIGAGLHFTVSICNRFLLVTEGCIIYIYSLRADWLHTHQPGGHLSLMTTIICPHRVLAVSMDTSSDRFAVAGLLEGRLGLVCDLHRESSNSKVAPGPRALSDTLQDIKSPAYSSHPSGGYILTEATSPRLYGTTTLEGLDRRAMYPSDQAMAFAMSEATIPDVHGARPVGTSWTLDDLYLTPVSPPPQTPPTFTNASYIPIENGSRSIYRNLCSAEDPPRSVAICPQRRCMAFGCAAGIELHWIDALTGQDLNRWFPLTAPSDFLYFLPPRPGVDSAKKLRLISSACHPKEQGNLRSKFFPGGSERLSWEEGLNDTVGWDHAWRGSASCDHYQAVPISDGWNILFTDPEDGNLCLGDDAPPDIGATKLVRRYVLVGPKDAEGKAIVPRTYRSGGELRWATRVVVGYGERLWLFVVPPDEFAKESEKTQSKREQQNAVEGPITPIPTRIDGVEFGRVPKLVDIAVDSTGGDLTVWAFAINGMAYVWQLGGGPQPITRRIVLNDGSITSATDLDGDTFMHGTSSPIRHAVQFDGSVSARPTMSMDFREQDRIIDRDSDIAMPDVTSQEDEGYTSGTEEFEQAGGAFAIHTPPLWGTWSEESADWVPDFLQANGEEVEDESLGVDMLELGRCEIEILSSHMEVGGVGFSRWTTEIADISR